MPSALDPSFVLVRPTPQRKQGRTSLGENNSMCKLTEDQVRAIFADPRRGKARQQIAKEYGVTVETVKNIQYGYTWKHLKLTSK